MVEVLGSYSKQRGLENTALSVIEQARECQKQAARGQTPTGNKNEIPAGNRNKTRERVRVLTPEEVENLVAAYLSGDSTYDLSRRYGIRRETVSAHLRRNNVTRRPNAKVVRADETAERVVELKSEGVSVRRIAREFGVTERVVARTLDEAGVERFTINNRAKERRPCGHTEGALEEECLEPSGQAAFSGLGHVAKG